ncbi:MAG: type II toxin-antitoxin system VapC family toxin [Armatimonadota bacterium]|nr:type II toxin-antitoxin system VapC family toxin [Armatimonadota bacterium]
MDSSGWIDYLTDGPRADRFEEYLQADDLLVPAIVLYEVYKWMKREVSEHEAMAVAARLRHHQVVPLDQDLALEAADTSLRHGLAMADAIVYATARHYSATLVTGEADFSAIPDGEYIAEEK